MTNHDKDLILKEIRDDVKELNKKIDGFIERISAAEVYIKGHSTILMFISLVILSIIGYIITGAWE